MPTLQDISIRQINEADNAAVAHIIRSTLKEFKANKPGTVYYDPTTDTLFEVFNSTSKSIYYVAEFNNEIVGGAGIFPSDGLPVDTCELVKMYLLPAARSIGLGKLLVKKCIAFAKEAGYKKIYLETLPELKQAQNMYSKLGFSYIKNQMGNTGHHGCDLFMLKDIS